MYENRSSDEAKHLAVGDLVLGRFQIVRHLGSGGMGDVYEALDLELGRIALKVIRSDIALNNDALLRFKREVQLARRISSPKVCRIHELFVIPGDTNRCQRAFLTMEFLEGITLADKVAGSGPMPWRDAQKIGVEICEGLQTIHEAGIIHRDLKCQNVMLTSRNGISLAVLMDFGLAYEMLTPTSETRTDFTEPGLIVGTPAYMAPEQLEGRPLSPATDVYAFGIVLYELLAGKRPSPVRVFGATAVKGSAPRLPSSIQRRLPNRCDEILCRCMEFDPKDRYQAASQVAEDLKGALPWTVRLKKRGSRLLMLSIAFALLCSGVFLIRERLKAFLPYMSSRHIAVLPFDLDGDDPQTVALGDGLVDSLAGKLSNLDHANSSLWVVPASEVRNRNVNDPSSALREFGATIAVKGRFSRNGNNVHLNLTLIDTKNMRELGFATAENQTGDLAALEDDVVKQLGRVMNLSVRDETTQNVGRPIAPSIYEDYILAIGYIQRFDKPGNVEHAISALQKAVATDPKFALGFARLAQVYVLKYQLDRNPRWLALAQEYCKHALELDNRVPLAHVALAQVQQRTGHHDLAIEEFQHAIDLDPRDTDALVGIASVYLDLGRNADAETAYLKAAALRPDDWSGYNALGIFYDQIGRHEDAIRQFRHAIELTPDNSALYANLGSAYLNSGDRTLFKAAEDALTKSASMNPDYATYANLGSLYEIQHRFDDSIAACQKALSLNDQSYDVWNTLTAAYEWKGENQKAITSRKKALDLLEQRIRLNPQDQDAMATLAALVAKNGQKDKALQAIQTALALSPESAYVLAEAADVYELLGDRQRAIGYLNQALVHGLAADQLSGDPELQGVITDPHFPKGRT